MEFFLCIRQVLCQDKTFSHVLYDLPCMLVHIRNGTLLQCHDLDPNERLPVLLTLLRDRSTSTHVTHLKNQSSINSLNCHAVSLSFM